MGRVKNTYYTDDGRICRTRQCGFCEFKWWTLQYPETNIDPATTLVRIERWGKSTGSKKQVQIINVVTYRTIQSCREQAARPC